MTTAVTGAQPTSDSATTPAVTASATTVVETPPAATTPPAAATTTPGAPAQGTPPAAPATPIPVKLAIPDGAAPFIDETDLRDFEALATREQWSKDDAQGFLAEQVALRKSASDKFLADAKAHPEIGGEHLEAAQRHARSVLDRFLPVTTPDGEALRRGLTKSGFANYPPLVVLLARIGKAMGEDAPGSIGQGQGRADKSFESVLYDKTTAT